MVRALTKATTTRTSTTKTSEVGVKFHKIVDLKGRLVQVPMSALLHLLCEVCGWQAYVPRIYANRTAICPVCRVKSLHWTAGLEMAVVPLLPQETLEQVRRRPEPGSSPSASTEYFGPEPEENPSDLFLGYLEDLPDDE